MLLAVYHRGLGDKAIPVVIASILEMQSTAIDEVSGAIVRLNYQIIPLCNFIYIKAFTFFQVAFYNLYIKQSFTYCLISDFILSSGNIWLAKRENRTLGCISKKIHL